MPLPRVRFTVRRMMVAVAIVAPIIGLAVQIERGRRWAPTSAYYQQRADATERRRQAAIQRIATDKAQIAENEKQARINKDYPASVESFRRSTDQCLERIAAEGRMAERCEGLRAKYERAARRPWLPVAPDPPEPE